MNWYYVDAGQQAGPVDDARLAELVTSGTIRPETLVWNEGMAGWLPYRDVAQPASGVATPPPPQTNVPPTMASGQVACSECGRIFPSSDVIRYEDKYICASCKPIFFQRLSEGATLTRPSAGATATEGDILVRDYEVDIGGSISASWTMFKADAGIIIGATVLVYLALMAINVIPYLGILLALFLNGPLVAGLWLFYIKKCRGGEVTIGDAFGGFGPRFWQLVLTQLIPGLLTGAFGGILAAIGAPAMIIGMRQGGGGSSNVAPALMAALGVFVLIYIIVMTYLNICWLFAIPLAADKGLKFWPALELSRKVVNKHWWMTFWLVVVSSLLAFVGLIFCCIPVIVTGPVAFGAFAFHYNKVFGDLAPSQTST